MQQTMRQTEKIYGAIEAGGTKMVCAVGRADGTLLGKMVVPTGTPETTIGPLCDFFAGRGISALGLATFGPVMLDASSPRYGRVLASPKLAWRDFDFAGALRNRLGVPVAIETDVNAACLGETLYGTARGLDVVVYVTVGTGIGVGVCIDGKPLHGMLHPEAGHITVARTPGDEFPGCCAVHVSCLEGLASGPAACKRYGVERASDLAEDAAFLDLESDYLARALSFYTLAYSPRRIVLGGGVPDHAPALLPLVREKLGHIIGTFLPTSEFEHLDSYVAAPSLKGDQGVLGALALAVRAGSSAASAQ